MRTCYVFEAVRAIADLVPPGELTRHWTITRINVPEAHRGLMYGSQLLDMILADADREGVTLALEPSPSGGLDYDQLTAWYRRHGFRMTRLRLHGALLCTIISQFDYYLRLVYNQS